MPPYPPPYLAWFDLFEAEDYFEAHEVLEQLWRARGRSHPDHAFFKGLIQISGIFRHLQLHHQAPSHRIHGARLGPAMRLLDSAMENLAGYPKRHLGLDLPKVRSYCERYRQGLRANPAMNPWAPGKSPPFPHPE
jgi:predicted metal-dependent hydrolase